MKKSLTYLLLLSLLYSCSTSQISNDKMANNESKGKCPLHFGSNQTSGLTTTNQGNTNRDWWPNQLDLTILRQNSSLSNPMGEEFSYAKAFKSLDYYALKKDIEVIMTESKDWWPADYGNYGGLFIRMAWHSAGTYRTGDGRGGTRAGQQRFAPQNSWPDNANLDKARRLLWPIKQKYGQKISWSDLMILAGNVALESMGFKTIGFAGGRTDVWEPQSNVYWGAEKKFLDDERYTEERELEQPLAAVQMGLIYVNPEGPNGEPDPIKAAVDIRETFARMGMNDEETVALIAGGHTLGKTHGAASGDNLGESPEGAGIEQQGMGWKSEYKSGKGEDAITSGLEVIWTEEPTKWNHGYFESLFENEWKLTKSPGGANQWVAKNPHKMFPDAFDSEIIHKPTMLTTDLSLLEDSAYRIISQKFYEDPVAFELAFAKAWFKLTHRDMGPKSTYLGPEIPKEEFTWQDPIPSRDHDLVSDKNIASLKNSIQNSKLTNQDMVTTAWASASTFRISDKRGGANGSRIRLEPQINWESNNPEQLKRILNSYIEIQQEFESNSNQKISIADLIVLGGCVAIEDAASKAGYDISVPFSAGRMDASSEETNIEGMEVLEPMADGFRNYQKADYTLTAEQLLVDKSQLLTLTAPEMTVLVGGMRVLNSNYDNSSIGVLTETPGLLNNDYFKNLCSMDYEWKAKSDKALQFDGYFRGTEEIKWTASRTDLIFGSNSELRAICEVYASDDSNEKFVTDFVNAWTKVMNLDRFEI
ncbi:MAG: catalase/peroxidase HPI [Crocinitomicaceae bacterium]|nr:catalase/peroxidase HPI [Crocinitomicaceae bacterium]